MTRQPPRRSASATTRLLAAAGLAALLGGMAFIVMGKTGDDGAKTVAPRADNKGNDAAAAGQEATRPDQDRRDRGWWIRPRRGQVQNGGDARLATDGNATTAWKTEHYRSTFSKSGVGVVLDAGRPVKASRVVVTTKTPGYAAQVQVGNSAAGPFSPVSKSMTTTSRTTFALKPRRGRYLVVWITSMPAGGEAAVNEVRVTAEG